MNLNAVFGLNENQQKVVALVGWETIFAIAIVVVVVWQWRNFPRFMQCLFGCLVLYVGYYTISDIEALVHFIPALQ